MATYAVGDIQGCFFSFQRLLEDVHFDPDTDRLWLVGDLINRGAGSLATLRWLYAHRSCVTSVLGNHDLHTLAVAEGFVPAHKSDTLNELLTAPDAPELLGWMRHQHMIHQEDGYVMVHAGLLPQWDIAQALALGREVETVLRGPAYRDFLAHMYGNQPDHWRDDLQGYDRLRLITNAMTRLRVCSPEGRIDFKFKGELDRIPAGTVPWFDVPSRASRDATLVCGHWSALGLQRRSNFYALDTGCLWGGQLTAMRLEDKAVFQVPCDLRDSPRKIEPAED